jgi:aspartate kinase
MLIVQKFGGSSLANAERIRRAAGRIAAARADGVRVVAVVSAMGDTTDELIALARSVTPEPDPRELDLLLSTGETVSATLVAMALRALGCPAVALTAHQAGIRTTKLYTRARITDIHPDRVRRELEHGRVPVVTGFQGVTEDLDVTTLGRGGSDTTAVALACALGADRCDIYTDVAGVFTADPRLVPAARKLDRISYAEMLELAHLGARVMHPRAVELGELFGMPIWVRSSFSDEPGTLITGGGEMEVRKNVRGIAHELDVAKVTLAGVPDRPGVAAALFMPLAEAGILVDSIVQTTGRDGRAELSFTVKEEDLSEAARLVEEAGARLGAERVERVRGLAKVSIVGTGIRSAPGYAARMFATLAQHDINIDTISTSDIRVTCVIAREAVPTALVALHEAFELDRDGPGGRAETAVEAPSAPRP